jgi:hypothetical protein
MVDYYQLLNKDVPPKVWLAVVKANVIHGESLSQPSDEGTISADIESPDELRCFIGCMLDLLRKGYVLDADFKFSSTG